MVLCIFLNSGDNVACSQFHIRLFPRSSRPGSSRGPGSTSTLACCVGHPSLSSVRLRVPAAKVRRSRQPSGAAPALTSLTLTPQSGFGLDTKIRPGSPSAHGLPRTAGPRLFSGSRTFHRSSMESGFPELLRRPEQEQYLDAPWASGRRGPLAEPTCQPRPRPAGNDRPLSGHPSGPHPSSFRRAGVRAPPNDLLGRRSAGGGGV